MKEKKKQTLKNETRVLVKLQKDDSTNQAVVELVEHKFDNRVVRDN